MFAGTPHLQHHCALTAHKPVGPGWFSSSPPRGLQETWVFQNASTLYVTRPSTISAPSSLTAPFRHINSCWIHSCNPCPMIHMSNVSYKPFTLFTLPRGDMENRHGKLARPAHPLCPAPPPNPGWLKYQKSMPSWHSLCWCSGHCLTHCKASTAQLVC